MLLLYMHGATIEGGRLAFHRMKNSYGFLAIGGVAYGERLQKGLVSIVRHRANLRHRSERFDCGHSAGAGYRER